ncbi:MAG: response regulator [Anaerolineales bacterium]
MSDKHSILIVEDDLDLAEMLTAYFRVQGYEVQTVAWGEDAVRATLASQPDLVMLDIRLPDIDGYDVCRRLRADRRTAMVPILFLTERRDRVDKLQGLKLGAVDYITKPFDIQELKLRVRNTLRRAGQESVLNPVTGLPDGRLVEDRLRSVADDEDWAVLIAKVAGLDRFQEDYGFVACDDVLRAISLMVSKAARAAGTGAEFIGHLSGDEFVVVTTASLVDLVREQIESRLNQSIRYFYPLKDRESLAGRAIGERLSVVLSIIVGERSMVFPDVDALRNAIAINPMPAIA